MLSQHPKIATQEVRVMELSVAPSSAHCAATTISSSFSKWCSFPVPVSHTEQMLEVVTLLRGGPLRVRPAELRNPTLFLRKALCGHFLLALQIHAPGSDRMASSSCGAPSILFHGLPKTRPLFLSHGSLVLGFFQDVRTGEPDVEPPSRRVRSGMRVLRKPLCHVWGSSTQPSRSVF